MVSPWSTENFLSRHGGNIMSFFNLSDRTHHRHRMLASAAVVALIAFGAIGGTVMSASAPASAAAVVTSDLQSQSLPSFAARMAIERRVLKQGGRYLFNVFDSLAFNPCPRVVSELLALAFKIDPPPFLQVPYGYASIDPIVASLYDAGFLDVRIDVINLMSRVDDLAAFAAAFVLGSPLADQIRARGMEPLELIAQVESALSERALKDGCAPLRAIMFDAATR
jgi:hypothetical protein